MNSDYAYYLSIPPKINLDPYLFIPGVRIIEKELSFHTPYFSPTKKGFYDPAI